MQDAHDFLVALTVVLCTAGVTTVLFQALGQPVVLGYLLAGLLVGPHVPVPLVADAGIVQTLAETGVILLMFSLGLEFRLGKLVQLAPTAGLTGILQSSFVLWLGYLAGRALGWTPLESVFTGAALAISSTTIIAKAFDEQTIAGRLRELVVGVLIVEDLIAILLMAVLTAVAQGEGASIEAVLRSGGELAAFLGGLSIVGILVVPRAMRAILRLDRPETTVVASIGLCFATALLASAFGYSVALGAFLAGSLVAESGEGHRVARSVQPVRDLFAAVFFVSVGMTIDPGLALRHAPAVAALTAIVIVGKVLGVTVGAFLTGHGTRTSVRAGMSLAQIGEFSFILAGLGTSLKVAGEFLLPVIVSVSAITTLTTPWMIRLSGAAASLVDRKLPRALQTYASLYGSWVERLRGGDRGSTTGSVVRRLARLLALDATIVGGIVVTTSLLLGSTEAFLAERLGAGPALARALVVGGSALLCAPFLVGIFRLARRLGATLAAASIPESGLGRADTAAAPRRALILSLQLMVVLLVGLPLLAATHPFVPGWEEPSALAAILVILGIAFWRSAANLQGHVKAGAEIVAEALGRYAQGAPASTGGDHDALEEVNRLLPGLGEPVALRIAAGAAAEGRTLADLNVRALTGATVLAITRGGAGVLVPSAEETLRAGDVLALAGTQESVEAARALLTAPAPHPPPGNGA